MRPSHRTNAVGLVAVLCLLASTDAAAQSLLDRTPNQSGGWVGPAGTAHFNFLHRFEHGDPPARKVINFPTFLFGYAAGPLLLAAHYATNSDLVASYPNEWEPHARYALPEFGPLRVALTGAWNSAAESIDGEASLRLSTGALALLGSARAFSAGYDAEDARFALGGGAVLSLHPNVALAGDVVTLLDREPGEEVAWGAALQLRIPSTPHTLSLQATNTNTATLQGSSRGASVTRYGFEFTVPITLGRYFGRSGGGSELVATGADTVTIAIRNFEYLPSRVVISPGTTVVWVNEDQVVHTATADGRAWDSGDLATGERYSRTFVEVGETSYHCTPHPFMTATIAVTARGR